MKKNIKIIFMMMVAVLFIFVCVTNCTIVSLASDGVTQEPSKLAEWVNEHTETLFVSFIAFFTSSVTGVAIVRLFAQFLNFKKAQLQKKTEEEKQERLSIIEENLKKEESLKEHFANEYEKLKSNYEVQAEHLKNERSSLKSNIETVLNVAKMLNEVGEEFKNIKNKMNDMENLQAGTLEILKYISTNNCELVINGKARNIVKAVDNLEEERNEE